MNTKKLLKDIREIALAAYETEAERAAALGRIALAASALAPRVSFVYWEIRHREWGPLYYDTVTKRYRWLSGEQYNGKATYAVRRFTTLKVAREERDHLRKGLLKSFARKFYLVRVTVTQAAHGHQAPKNYRW